MKETPKTLNISRRDAFERCYSRLNIVVGAANSIAGKWLYDTIEELEKHPRTYRFGVKHDACECKRMFDEYERAHLTNHCGLKDFYLDYLDTMDERVGPHVERMYWAIKNRLDKARVERSGLFARIEMTLTLIDYSVYLYDFLIADVSRQTGYDFDRILRPARLGQLLRRWESLEKRVCKVPKGTCIDLNKDETCMTGMRCIENILTNEDVLNEAAKEAVRLNPDIMEQFGIDLSDETYFLGQSGDLSESAGEQTKDPAA